MAKLLKIDTKKVMKIKSKIIISYVIVIILISIFWGLIVFFDYNDLSARNLKLSVNSLEQYYAQNQKAEISHLSEFSIKYLQLVNENRAKALEPTVKSILAKHENVATDSQVKQIIYPFLKINGYIIGYSFIMNKDKYLIASPNNIDMSFTPNEFKTKFSLLYNLMEEVEKDGHSQGYYNFYYVTNEGIPTNVLTDKFAVFDVIPGTDYYLGTTIFLNNYQQYTNAALIESQKNILSNLEENITYALNSEFTDSLIKGVILVLIITLIFIIFGYLLAKNLSYPITKFSDKLKKINPSNLNEFNYEYLNRNDEVGELSRSFKFLSEELMTYMSNFEKEVQHRQSIENELEIAKEIQDSSLPELTDEFRNREFDLFAKIVSAKTVAGDFYDFFFINKNTLAVLIADVSGKGISAAFFMSKIKDLVRLICLQNQYSPSNALENANRIISQSNKTFMFITAFLIYYDIRTGSFMYANAGHNNIIKIHKSGHVEEFGEMCNTVLGFDPEIKFDLAENCIKSGEFIALYTDGITEAYSDDNEMFGENKLEKILLDNKDKKIEDIVKIVFSEVDKFETEQSDDRTFVILKHN